MNRLFILPFTRQSRIIKLATTSHSSNVQATTFGRFRKLISSHGNSIHYRTFYVLMCFTVAVGMLFVTSFAWRTLADLQDRKKETELTRFVQSLHREMGQSIRSLPTAVPLRCCPSTFQRSQNEITIKKLKFFFCLFRIIFIGYFV